MAAGICRYLPNLRLLVLIPMHTYTYLLDDLVTVLKRYLYPVTQGTDMLSRLSNAYFVEHWPIFCHDCVVFL